MSVTVSTEKPYKNLTDKECVIAYHVLGILNNDRKKWSDTVQSAAHQDCRIPRSTSPHMHPNDIDVPCMFCASRTCDISAVSASIIMSVAECHSRDDSWNSDPIRRPGQVFATARNLVIDDTVMEDMFGPHWGLVVAFGYRIEFSDAQTLVDLLRTALTSTDVRHTSKPCGRDWTHSARWLVAVAMSGRRQVSDMSARLKRQDRSTVLASLASTVSLHGTLNGSVEEWMVSPHENRSLPSERPKLRVVR